MRRALAGSIAMHGALGVLLLGIAIVRPSPRPRPVRAPLAVELVAPAAAPPPTPAPAGGAPASAPAPAPRPAWLAPRRSPATVREALAETAIERREVGGDDGGGSPDGTGRGGLGGGTGIGLGEGAGIAPIRELPPPPPAPPPPRISKARPARLIYPVRQREADEDEMFHARVVVDREGYVVGARIVRGTGGPREERAAQAIWSFRYAPALDDDGRAIQSTVDQPFLVNH